MLIKSENSRRICSNRQFGRLLSGQEVSIKVFLPKVLHLKAKMIFIVTLRCICQNLADREHMTFPYQSAKLVDMNVLDRGVTQIRAMGQLTRRSLRIRMKRAFDGTRPRRSRQSALFAFYQKRAFDGNQPRRLGKSAQVKT